MVFAGIRSGEPIPVFNGSNYPFWKDTMMRNIKAQDNDAWILVQDGVPEIHPLNNPDDNQKRLILLDKQTCVFITNHLDESHYHLVRNIESSKDVWDYIQKISEGANS